MENEIKDQSNNGDKVGNDYGAGIGMAKFISFIGWLTVVAGIALFISGAFLVFGISNTIGIIVSGFMLIMGGQITRATAENSNYSKQMLEIMKKQ